MAPSEDAARSRPPRYEDEDTSVTTRRELLGWYSYGLAAEVFAVCGVGSFLPVTLEQLARESGVLWSDHNLPCITRVAPANATELANPTGRLLARASDRDPTQCVVFPFGGEVTTASFAMYTFSVAVFVQALCLISFSAFADHGNARKRLLLAFSFIGAASAMSFILVSPQLYILGAILVIIGVTCLGSSYVIANSFLPLLVANDPVVGTSREWAKYESSGIPLDDLSNGLQTSTLVANGTTVNPVHPSSQSTFQDKVSPAMRLSTQISSTGVGIGYCSAVFVQLLSIALLFTIKKAWPDTSQDLPLRLVLLLVGAWWLVFTIPVLLYLRDRPGPPLLLARHTSNIRTYLAYIGFAWSSLFRTVRTAFRLRQVILFLLSWFMLSDAIATISGTAILFARTELHMSTVAVAVISIIATSSGIVGAFTWPIISRRFALSTNHTIIACILLMEIIPLYGLLGYLPAVKAWGVGGLQQAWEIYPLAFIHGMVMGGLSSYCRSFYGLLIPPGHEAAFYALYAVTDKGSSAVGPAVVGALVDATGSIRPAFAFLAVLVILPIPLIWSVNVEKGQEDARRIAGLKGKDDGDELHADNDAEAEGLLNSDEMGEAVLDSPRK